jgi:hypothetical protein
MVDALIAQHEVAAGRAEPVPTSASLAPPSKQSDDGITALSERSLQRISSYFEQVCTPFLISSPSMKGARTLSGKQRAVQLLADTTRIICRRVDLEHLKLSSRATSQDLDIDC